MLSCASCVVIDKALYDQSAEDVDELLTSCSVGRSADLGSGSVWTPYHRSACSHLLSNCASTSE